MSADPSVTFGTTLSPHPGWLKAAQVNGINVLFDSASLSHQNNFQFTKYALTFPSGLRQKTLHSRGTREISFSISGELSTVGAEIINFLQPYYRGLIFPIKILQHATKSEEVLKSMMENFTLSGQADGIIKYTMSGKGLTDILSSSPWEVTGHRYPIPAWSSGNEFVRSWTLSHQTSLQPAWYNNQNTIPAYYRVGPSEYSLEIQTMVEFREYDTISIGLGVFAMIEGIVTSRAINYSRDPKVYNVKITNVSVTNDNPLALSALVVPSAGPTLTDWL